LNYSLLADLVVLVHFAFVAFAVLGGLLVLRWQWLVWLHVPAAIWAAGIEFGGWICPLTWLEDWLVTMAGGLPAEATFVERYIVPVLYPEKLTRGIQVAMGFAVILVNLAIYGILFPRVGRKGRGRKQHARM
jgi:hypothetical protein